MTDISPLFALEAEELLEAGKIDESIALCREGLEAYPDYPAGLAILSRALKEKGDEEGSKEVIKNASRKYPAYKGIKSVAEPAAEKEAQDITEKVPEKDSASDEVDIEALQAEIAAEEEEASQEAGEEQASERMINQPKDSPEENIDIDALQNEIAGEAASEEAETEIDNDEPLLEAQSDEFESTVELPVSKEEEFRPEEKPEENLISDEYDPDIEAPEEIIKYHEESSVNRSELFSNKFKYSDHSAAKINAAFMIDIPTEAVILPNTAGQKDTREIEVNTAGRDSGMNLSASDAGLIPGLDDEELDQMGKARIPQSKLKPDYTSLPELNLSALNFEYSSGSITDLNEIETDIARLAELVAKTKTAKEDNDINDFSESKPKIRVTETLAEIYKQQGAYEEAVKAYETLADQYPEKDGYYAEKINEIIEMNKQRDK
ncbi:MAG: tetratricopeptide repeat protein [Candidatus Kapaibacterium sp.]